MPKQKMKSKSDLKEKLADIEHQRWSSWQKHCHKILRKECPSPELEKVLERWDRQIATDYKDLSGREKDSDREQVDRYWHLIEPLIDTKTQLIDFAIEVVREWAFEGSESGEDYYCFEPDEPSIEKAFRILYDNKIIKYKDRVYVKELEEYESKMGSK